jgi:hypothetical protein
MGSASTNARSVQRKRFIAAYSPKFRNPSHSLVAFTHRRKGSGGTYFQGKGERLDNDPSGTRYGCFLPDLTGLARSLSAPTSQRPNSQSWLLVQGLHKKCGLKRDFKLLEPLGRDARIGQTIQIALFPDLPRSRGCRENSHIRSDERVNRWSQKA